MGRKSQYSEDYKREAVAKAEASGNVSQTAREMGISNKSLHAWIKQHGHPLDAETASVKELSARVRQLERQLAMREGQLEVLKKPSGLSAKPSRTVRDDPTRASDQQPERGSVV
jgi:transposase